VPVELDDRQDLAYPLGDLALGQLAHPQAERDILADRLVRPHRVALEDQRHVAPLGWHHRAGPGQNLAADGYLAAVRGHEAGQQLQGRALAATGRAEQGEHLAIGDFQVDGVQGDHVAVCLAQANNPNHLAPPVRSAPSRPSSR
jgi:hypothetical protein